MALVNQVMGKAPTVESCRRALRELVESLRMSVAPMTLRSLVVHQT